MTFLKPSNRPIDATEKQNKYAENTDRLHRNQISKMLKDIL